jgi:tetratricopeptide (TPR) repeat protein
LDVLKRIEDEEAAPRPPAFEISVGNPEEVKIRAFQEIGRAQALVGDLEAAQGTWKLANILIHADGQTPRQYSRATLLLSLARAQAMAGSRDAEATLTRANEAARRALNGDEPPVPPVLGEAVTDAARTHAETLIQIGAGFDRIGNRTAAQKAFREALAAAEAVKKPADRVAALAYLARAQKTPDADETWRKATRGAFDIADEYTNYCAVEALLRGRVNAGHFDEAIRTVAELLKGDLMAFGLRAVAEALAGADADVDPAMVERLLEIAQKVDFDRARKREHVYTHIASISARMGDDKMVHRVLGLFPVGDGQMQVRDHQTRVDVLLILARAQLAKKRQGAAKDTLQAAWETVKPYMDCGEGWRFPIDEIGTLRVSAGDVQGARILVESTDSGLRKVKVLTALASAHGEAGDRDVARAHLAQAIKAQSLVRNDVLWGFAPIDRNILTFAYLPPPSPMEAARPRDRFIDRTQEYDALQQIALAQARIGDVGEALKTAKSSLEWEGALIARGVFADIARIQAKSGDFAGAYSTLGAEPSAWTYPFAIATEDMYAEIAKVQAEAGDFKGALEWSAKAGVKAANPRPDVGRVAERLNPTAQEASREARIGVLIGLAEGISARKKPVDAAKRKTEKAR